MGTEVKTTATQPTAMRGSAAEHLLVKSITFADGQAIDVGTVTVFTGPNNSGKTELLHDLLRLIGSVEHTGQMCERDEELGTNVVTDVAFVPKLNVDRLVRGLTAVGDASEEVRIVQGIGPDLKTPHRRTIAQEVKNILYRPVLTARGIRATPLREIMPLRVAFLGTGPRQPLLSTTLACSPARPPENLLQALRFAEPQVHEELDSAFSQAFPETHVRLDATEQVSLYLRVAQAFPAIDRDPIVAVRQYAALGLAEEEGDGCCSFLAPVLMMLLCQGRAILLDHPETHLHTDTAHRLGVWVSTNAARLGCQVFLATHSRALVQGLLEGDTAVTICRMTRKNGRTTVRAMQGEIPVSLARFPLLTSQRALDCLFCDGAAIVSKVEDRIVYETVAQRFLDGGAIRFFYTQSARGLGSVAKLFRRAGIAAVVIAELDLLQSEARFSDLVTAVTGNPPPAPWLATRERLAKYVEGMVEEKDLSADARELESFLSRLKGGTAGPPSAAATRSPRDLRSKWNQLQSEQLGCLPQELRVWVEDLLDELKAQGIFVSPKGGFQGWLFGEIAHDDPDVRFSTAVQSLNQGECPSDLRAFVAEVLAHIRSRSVPTRAGRARPAS